ncbi:Unknown protein, partial [Striga hermonthica]
VHEDVVKVLTGGPYVIGNGYMHVQPWSITFDATQAEVTSTVAWIRLPGMPAHLYHNKVFRTIGRIVGKVIKIDQQKTALTRGKFARLAVVVDITKSLCVNFTLNANNNGSCTRTCPLYVFTVGDLATPAPRAFTTRYPKTMLPTLRKYSPTALYMDVNGGGGKPATSNRSDPSPYGPWIEVPQWAKQQYSRRNKGPAQTPKNPQSNPNQGSRFGVLGKEAYPEAISNFEFRTQSVEKSVGAGDLLKGTARNPGEREWRTVTSKKKSNMHGIHQPIVDTFGPGQHSGPKGGHSKKAGVAQLQRSKQTEPIMSMRSRVGPLTKDPLQNQIETIAVGAGLNPTKHQAIIVDEDHSNPLPTNSRRLDTIDTNGDEVMTDGEHEVHISPRTVARETTTTKRSDGQLGGDTPTYGQGGRLTVKWPTRQLRADRTTS